MIIKAKPTMTGCYLQDKEGSTIAKLSFNLQPIVNNKNCKTVSFECLSKLEFQDEKKLSNEEFFGRSCVELIKGICITQIEYFNEFQYSDDVMISYNMPLSALLDDVYVDTLTKICRNSSAIEITSFDIEKLTSGVLYHLLENIHRLKSRGIMLWLDDFVHTDITHQRWLHLLEWDSIKLDKSYLLESECQERVTNLIESLSDHCSNIIVEGVETQDHYYHLSDKSVLLQGYFVSPPKPCSCFKEFEASFELES